MVHRDWYCEDVLSGKLDVDKVWEDERVLAFHHPEPKSKIHVIVIPKKHVPSLLDPAALDGELLISMLMAIQHVAKTLGLDKTGFYIRANAAEPGVTPHMHWHILGPGIPNM
jgi:histidine triad (HIT) family protein